MAILPPATLGMLGGGQLGRMFVIAARTMGYQVVVLDPDPDSPAGSLASHHLAAAYDDEPALDYLAKNCQVVTTEFENIPATTLDYLARTVSVFPSSSALRIAQNRKLEKEFVVSQGLNTAAFIAIENDDDLELAKNFLFPAILKTATLGYDGKGQVVCESWDELAAAFESVDRQACILEKNVELESEVSVILCRGQNGEADCFAVAENTHVNGILDTSVAPAEVSVAIQDEVRQAATKIADGLDYCGVLAVEFFITTDGGILVNEMAPRPHNSGHYTLDACYTSQFEQQLRMICGLPAGNSNQHTPVVMWNILGDIWPYNSEPAWDGLLDQRNVKLHLYGKKEARAGRKMGHINCLGSDIATAKELSQTVKDTFKGG